MRQGQRKHSATGSIREATGGGDNDDGVTSGNEKFIPNRLKEVSQALAAADALRRKRAVCADVDRCPLPPQPANPEVVQAISAAVRDWSVGEYDWAHEVVVRCCGRGGVVEVCGWVFGAGRS